MYPIQKNVPLRSKQAYPLDEMQAGDSFLVPCTDNQEINYIRAQIHALKKKRPGMVISTRKEDYGLRVWVVKK